VFLLYAISSTILDKDPGIYTLANRELNRGRSLF
jgi:hypothetical protein